MPKDLLTEQSVLVRNSNIFASKVDDELVMMDEKKGYYFGLNSVAARVWELLVSPLSYDVLLTRLVEIYGVEVDRCASEMRPFLIQMLERGLILIEPPKVS